MNSPYLPKKIISPQFRRRFEWNRLLQFMRLKWARTFIYHIHIHPPGAWCNTIFTDFIWTQIRMKSQLTWKWRFKIDHKTVNIKHENAQFVSLSIYSWKFNYTAAFNVWARVIEQARFDEEISVLFSNSLKKRLLNRNSAFWRMSDSIDLMCESLYTKWYMSKWRNRKCQSITG